MNNSEIKRRNLFIKKDFQGRFIFGVFSIIVLAGICSALLVYWLTGDDLQSQANSAHSSIIQAEQRLGISVFIGNLVSVLVAGAIAVATVLYASHKIAGPLYRFESLCIDIGNGNFDTITRLREKDQLQDLAVAFGGMVDKLKEQRDQRNALFSKINQQIGLCMFKNGELSQEQEDAIATLATLVAELEKLESAGK